MNDFGDLDPDNENPEADNGNPEADNENPDTDNENPDTRNEFPEPKNDFPATGKTVSHKEMFPAWDLCRGGHGKKGYGREEKNSCCQLLTWLLTAGLLGCWAV